jgi:hypothetical protein
MGMEEPSETNIRKRSVGLPEFGKLGNRGARIVLIWRMGVLRNRFVEELGGGASRGCSIWFGTQWGGKEMLINGIGVGLNTLVMGLR